MCMLAYDGLGLEDALESLSEWLFCNLLARRCIQLKFSVGVFIVSNSQPVRFYSKYRKKGQRRTGNIDKFERLLFHRERFCFDA